MQWNICIIWIYVIKPENILFDENNKIKLIDYGFSFYYKNTLINIFVSIIFFAFIFDLPYLFLNVFITFQLKIFYNL